MVVDQKMHSIIVYYSVDEEHYLQKVIDYFKDLVDNERKQNLQVMPIIKMLFLINIVFNILLVVDFFINQHKVYLIVLKNSNGK